MLIQEFKEKKNDFLTYLEIEKNLSEHTQRAYKNDLNQFINFWHMISKKKKEVTLREALDRFFITLYNKKIEKSSIARKISCFRSFSKFLKKYGIDVKTKLTRPKLDKKLPIYLSVKEIFYLLDTIDIKQLDTRKPLRDKAIFELLYATGVRCSELVQIKLSDLDIENKTIRIFGKGKKERFVLFGTKALERLQSYIQHERSIPKKHDERLFLNYRNAPLTTRSVQRVIALFRKFLRVKRLITPHKIRHSFATHLLQQGTDLRVIQELLGHKTLASTEKYTHVAPQELTDLYKNMDPFNIFIKRIKGNEE